MHPKLYQARWHHLILRMFQRWWCPNSSQEHPQQKEIRCNSKRSHGLNKDLGLILDKCTYKLKSSKWIRNWTKTFSKKKMRKKSILEGCLRIKVNRMRAWAYTVQVQIVIFRTKSTSWKTIQVSTPTAPLKTPRRQKRCSHSPAEKDWRRGRRRKCLERRKYQRRRRKRKRMIKKNKKKGRMTLLSIKNLQIPTVVTLKKQKAVAL